jgi:alpha-galactosidase
MSETSFQQPKVVILGAGSLFFGRQALWQMVHSPHLNKGTLALVDTNEERLSLMTRLAEMVIAENNVGLRLEASTDRKDVLSGADFVILSFAEDTVKYRGLDCDISARFGVRMCSGDTIGPGGIFRAMREFPVILECASDIETLCPQAWVINYINPAAVHGIGLRRYAPQLKSFALCDSLHMPHVKRRYAQRAGVLGPEAELTEVVDQAFDLRIAGVNHFTWILKAEFEGQERMPAIAESLRQQGLTESDRQDVGAKAKFNGQIGYALYQWFSLVPACIAHTKEYVPYWQGLGIAEEAIPPLTIWQTEPRYRLHEAMWRQVKGLISGKIPIARYMDMFGPDHATDVVENIVGALGKPFYVNAFNEGAVSNMAEDAFLELLCDIDLNGPRPRPVGEMPRGLRSLQELILDTHELTAEAVATCNMKLLRRAMLVDPLVNSMATAEAIIQALLEVEDAVLPDCWFD